MMKRWFKRLILLPTVVLAGLLSLIMVIGLFVLTFWINTNNGTQWIEDRIRAELSGTPYDIQLENLRLLGFSNIAVESIIVSYDDQVMAQASDMVVSVSILSMMTKTLDIALTASRISFNYLPPNDEPESPDNDNAMPFPMALGDIYFNRFDLSTNVQELVISETIMGNPFTTHWRSNHDIIIQDDSIVMMDGQIKTHETVFLDPDMIPQSIDYDAILDLQTGMMTINAVDIDNQFYAIEMDGQYDLSQNIFDIVMNANITPPIEGIEDYMSDPAAFSMNINGDTEQFTGQTRLTATIMGEDVLVETPLTFERDIVTLSAISGNIGDALLSGTVVTNINNGLVNGTVQAVFDDFDLLKHVAGDLPVNGRGTMNVNLSGDTGVQSIAVQSNLSNIVYDDMTAQLIDLSLNLPDVGNTDIFNLDVKATELNYGDIQIATASAVIAPDDKDGLIMDITANGKETEPFTFKGDIHVVDLDTLAIRINDLTLSMGQGVLNATGDIRPELSEIQATLNVTNDDIGVGTITANLIHRENVLNIDMNGQGDGIRSLDGKVTIPMIFTLKPFAFELSEQAAMNGFLKADLDIATITQPFLNGTGIDLSGQLKADATIGGSIASPTYAGYLSLEQGGFYDNGNDMRLTQIEGRANFNDKVLIIERLTANDGEDGSVSATGEVDLSDMGNPDASIDITANRMTIHIEQMIHAVLDAELTLRTRRNYNLSGTITPIEVNITLPDRFNESIPQLNIVEKDAAESNTVTKQLNLDIDLNAPNRVFIRGWGLDAELGGNLAIGGTADEPDIQGTLSSIRGRYEEFSRRFNITRANVRFQGIVPPSPYLDIVASTDVEDVTANIELTGPANQPDLSLSSVPSLPQDEILSRILFGKDSTQISPFQAVQLAQSVRRLSGMSTGPDFDPLGTLRSISGLDDITVEGVGTEDARVGAGKYISDKVYLEIEQGSGADSGAASVEVEISPNMTIESKAGRNGSTGGGVFWEWDY